MRDLFRAFQRIPEKNRTIAYGLMALLKNLFYFVFKVIVGIIFKNPLLVAIAIYNVLIGVIKATCARGLWKNKDDLKDLKTYISGGTMLALSSIFYIVYTANQVGNPYNITYTPIIAIAIACFATYSITVSIMGLYNTRGKTLLIKQYKFTNFATALTNLVLTQMAILSFMPIENMHFYNALLGIIVGSVILAFGLYIVIHGLVRLRMYFKANPRKKKVEEIVQPNETNKEVIK